MSEPSVTFAADRMLGRLVLWLRLLGFDTQYRSEWTGEALLRAARSDGRVVLTRNTRLVGLRDEPALLFIESDHFRDQLRQVLAAYALDPYAHLLTRCARCNVLLHSVPAGGIANRVPPYVLASQSSFMQCRRCARVYWHATHADHIHDELRKLGYSPPPAHT